MKKLLLSFVMMLTATMAFGATYYAIVDGVRYAGSGEHYAYVVAPEEGTYSGEITIRAAVTIEGEEMPVTRIDPDAFKGSAITKVTIPASVKTIRDNAFQDCTSLATVVLNEGLKEVGTSVFAGCTALKAITLPESLTETGSTMFEGSGLTSITLPGTLKYLRWGTFRYCESLTSATFAYADESKLDDEGWTYGKGVLQTDANLFDGCTNLTEVTMDREVHFYGYEKPFANVTKATFGSHVTTIPEKVLQGLTLEKLVIGANVTEIGDHAFYQATLPEGYAFPFSQMKKIGSEAFRECKNVPAIVNLTSIEVTGDNAFYRCESIESLTIGSGTIGYSAFYGCSNLSSLTLSEGMTEIGSSNFSYLTNLTSVKLPTTLKKIGYGAFSNCENLTIPDNLPEGLEEIGGSAFYNCKKLVVTLPSTLKIIDQSAFSGCESITEVTIPAGVTRLEGYTFMGTKITKLTIPKTLVAINAYDFESDKLEEITFEYGPDTLRMNDTAFGLWCTAKTVTIDRPFQWRQDRKCSFGYAETVTFGPHIESIPERALYEMSYLKKVTMTDNVKAIGKHAFYQAFSDEGFEMTMSKKLETIGERAFAYSNLRSFTFPITVKEIGEQAFTSNQGHNHYLKDIYVPWLTPLAVKDSDPETEYKMFYYDDNMTLWVPGGTMDAYKAAEVWGSFKKFNYWSYVVKANATGKGTLKVTNGQAVTDNGTNTELSVLGGSGNKPGETVSGLFVREKDITLTGNAENGYELKSATANGTALTVASNTAKVPNILADQTISATFGPIDYKITYNLAGGKLPEGKTNPATYTIEDGDITLTNPTREGYTFAGWTGTALDGSAVEVTIPTGSTGNRTYTATWTPITYTISYDLAGGAIALGENPTEYNIESEITLKAPTKNAYEFAGWTGTGLTEPTLVVTIAKGNMGNRSYTATWKPKNYNIDYDLAGGQLPDGKENPRLFNIETPTFTIVNPVRDNYEFTGWTGGGLTEPTMTVTIEKGSYGYRKYTATWLMLRDPADVNADGQVDVADIATVISVMADAVTDPAIVSNADVNNDGQVDVADIASIITRMAELSRQQRQ